MSFLDVEDTDALAGIDQYDLLGINPSTGRLTLPELQQRARAVSVLLARPVTGGTAQPVPYTLVQANAMRDWLNMADRTELFTTGQHTGQGTGTQTAVTAADRQRQVDRFYRHYDNGGATRSRWNPTAPSSTGRALNTADPAVMVPLFRGVVRRDVAAIDLTGDDSDGARPTGPAAATSPRAPTTPAATSATSDRATGPAAASPRAPTTPAGTSDRSDGSTGQTGRKAASRSSPSVVIPARANETTGPAPVAPLYIGRTDFDLATLVTRAADPAGQRVVVGLVRPVDGQGTVQPAAPALVVTVGADIQGRVNFRVVGRDIDGRTTGGAGRGNSINWAGMTGRGLVLLGRFRGASVDEIRDFAQQRSVDPSTARLPLSDRSPRHDSSPTGYAFTPTSGRVPSLRRSRSPPLPLPAAHDTDGGVRSRPLRPRPPRPLRP